MQTPKLAAASLVLALAAVPTMSGCASITGLVSGAITGGVDLPAQVYRTHQDVFEEEPIYWALNIFVLVPVGIVFGPLVGMCKGVALDVEWLIGKQEYGPVFGSYDAPSVWRPYTIHW